MYIQCIKRFPLTYSSSPSCYVLASIQIQNRTDERAKMLLACGIENRLGYRECEITTTTTGEQGRKCNGERQ